MEKLSPGYNHIGYFTIVITNTYSNKRLDLLLSEVINNLSRTRIKKLVDTGFVLLNGAKTEPSHITRTGEIVEVNIPELEDFSLKPKKLDLNLIYEDENLLVINKPANLVMHPGNGNHENTILNGLLYQYPESRKLPRAGIVHRLDKDTTGLVVVAKDQLSYVSLTEQILKKSVKRCYVALVWGELQKEIEVKRRIERDRVNRLRFRVSQRENGRFAHTFVSPVEFGRLEGKRVTLVECVLHTGRTHQIRVHMEDIGHPIVGDNLYKRGSPRPSRTMVIGRQALHAFSLSFMHPANKKDMAFTASLPPDLKNQINEARICHYPSSK